MHYRRPTVLFAVALPAILLQLDLSGCFQTGGPTGDGSGTGFNLPPTPIISTDVVRGVVPLTVRFSSSTSSDDGLIINRTWDFDDGQTSRDISPTHTFTATGNYDVRLTLVDELGVSASRTLTIAVTEAPIAAIRVDRTAAEFAPAVIAFDASGSRDPDGTIARYRWDFGDGSTEVLPVVAHTFTRSGTFRVRLTVTDNTGVTGSSEQIIVIGIRTPTIAFRTPPSTVSNIVVSNDSTLWVQAVFNVEQGVPRLITAGLDGDSDPCDAKAITISTANGSTLATYGGHSDRVRVALYSPSGASVLTASDDRTLQLFTEGTAILLTTFGNNTAAIASAAFSPDGTLIAYGQTDGKVVLRNVNSGTVIREINAHAQQVNSVAFSSNGTQFATGSDDASAIVFNVSDGSVARTLTGHAFGVTSVAFSPTDPTVLLTGSIDQTAKLWDTTSGATLVTFAPVTQNGTVVSGHSNSVTGVAFAPDGASILTGSDDQTLKLWDISGGVETRTFTGASARIASIAFSNDGLSVAGGATDGTLRIWMVADGALQRTVAPCSSSIRSVQFNADDSEVLVGIGARNSIKLDTSPPSGNDLNIAVPQGLLLTNVPIGQYSLWAQVETDRSSPVRTYSPALVNLVNDYTPNIDNFTPRAPLIGDAATIVVEQTTQRQVVDLGPMSEGDRIFLALSNLPGYANQYNAPVYSVMLLDADQKLFAWYQDNAVLLTPDTKLVVGHSSPNYYAVIDTGTSIDIRVQRGVGNIPRQQRIWLNFAGGNDVRVADIAPQNIPEFDATFVGLATNDTSALQARILQKVRELFATWDVEVTTSDDGVPDAPFQTIYFAPTNFTVDEFELYGIADYIDPRNDTLTGSAVIKCPGFAADFPNSTVNDMGDLVGVVVAHECGHLLGLRHVSDATDIMDTGPLSTTQVFKSSPLLSSEQYNAGSGTQDAPQLLNELIGLHP
ncbi:MAG: PKD domain-containing protein [Phycisphaerales bacterium]|nr:PKD domain-containing protein [Phycisphaerales bacterium]